MKNISITSEFSFTFSGLTNGAAFSIPLVKSSKPSGISGPTEITCSSVGQSGFASATWSSTTFSPTHTIALMSASWQRYTISLPVSRWVAGMTTAPILCSASIENQNSYRRLRIRSTLSPLPIPRLIKYDAVRSVLSLRSAYVKSMCAPWSFVQHMARFVGFSAAHASSTS